MLLQHSTHDPLHCSLWCESHYTAVLHLKRWWLWLSWCLHNFSSSLSALEILMYWGKPLNKNAPSMCANVPPSKQIDKLLFTRGFPRVTTWNVPHLHVFQAVFWSVLKPDTVSVNSVRRAILWFWLIYKMMSDTHVPFLLISNIMSCILAIAYIGQSDDYLKPCN